MSDSYASDITISGAAAIDVAAIYTAMAGVQSWIQNKGPFPVLVKFTASATASAAGGVVLRNGESWGGNAAHCWVLVLGQTATVAVGTV